MLDKLRPRFRALFFRSRMENELEEEVKFHLEKEVERNIARGMGPEEARYAALRSFGGVEQMKEESRDERGIRGFEELWQDLRYGMRVLLKHRSFTLVAALTLAFGIGVNTAMFSAVNALLLQSLPYPDANRLVRVYRTSPQSQGWLHSLPDFDDIVSQSSEFESLAAYSWWGCSLVEPGQPAEGIPGAAASANLFAALGVQPALGRGFTAEEQQPGRDQVVMLSHGFWQRRFAGDPGVIGRALRIDGESLVVIGVMPDKVSYPLFSWRVDIWRPLPLPTADDWRAKRSKLWLQMIGRLKPGISLEQAQAGMHGIAARLAREFPATNASAGLRVVQLQAIAMDDVRRNVIWLTLGLAVFVLLIACVNIANLHLARSAVRARDFAVRAALGASRGRLIRQLLVESTLLALAGGALGLLLARLINEALSARIEVNGETGFTFPLDLRALGFALFVSVATGVLSGSVPAWLASRTDLNIALKQSARGAIGDHPRHRLRHALIVAEIAFSLLLLAGSSFFIRGLQRAATADPGWNTDGLLIGNISLTNERYPEVEQRRLLQERLLQRVSELPGVERVAIASTLPIDANHVSGGIAIEGRDDPPAGQEPLAYITLVNPSFFETLGIRLVEGRLFPSTIGHKDPPVAVINETMARRFWPNESALGKRIRDNDQADRQWHEVIGVVRDVAYPGHFGTLDTRLQIYRPMVRESWNNFVLAVRAAAPDSLTETLRRTVAGLDGDLPLAYPRTVERALDYARHNFHVVNQILGAFAFLGLMLAAVGLYGVISGTVAQRTQEFGIRMALGARARAVLWLVLGRGALLAILGILLGLAGTAGLWHVLGAMIPGLQGQDLTSLALIAGLLLAVALAACLLPARRATKIDPLAALRRE
jgi:putative ABC transport system permease protein